MHKTIHHFHLVLHSHGFGQTIPRCSLRHTWYNHINVDTTVGDFRGIDSHRVLHKTLARTRHRITRIRTIIMSRNPWTTDSNNGSTSISTALIHSCQRSFRKINKCLTVHALIIMHRFKICATIVANKRPVSKS